MRKVIFVILVIGITIFLTGCFDRIDRIKINKDGSGVITLKTVGDPSFLTGLGKDITSPSSNVRKFVKDETFFIIEEARFKSLEELNYELFSFSLRCNKKALLPFRPSLFRFKARVKGKRVSIRGGNLDNLLDNLAAMEESPISAGHFYQIVIEVPGKIVKAYPVTGGNITIEPTIEENSVSWKIPLSLCTTLFKKNIIFCLDFKAKMNLPKEEIISSVNTKDKFGRTALMYAACEGDTEFVKTLLAEGADVNAKDKDGVTALMGAAWNGHTEIVKALLAKGADVNIKDKDGRTALRYAILGSHAEIVRLLKKEISRKKLLK